MKWLYLLVVTFVLIFDCKAQTNVISVNVGDYGLQPLSNRVTLNLIYPNPRIYNNTLISQAPISITTSNGVGRFTNIIWGQYRVDVDTVPVTKFLVNVNTNSTGNITLASLVTGPEVFPTQTTNTYYTNYFQTNIIRVNIADYGLAPQSMRITLTLISPNPRTYNNYLISSTPISTVTGTNGIGYFTNIIWGQYRADLASTPVTKFMINVNTNSIGSVSFVSLITDTAALPPNPTTNYYNQAQIDSLLSGIKASAGITNAYATNIAGVLVTNQSIYISTNYSTTNYVLSQGFVTSSITNGLATTNYVNTATNGFVSASVTNGLATTNYVNTATNGLVTASITNGLATTNYVKAATNGLPGGIWTLGTASQSNSAAFAPSTVTNLTSNQIATIAAAITNGDYPGTAATFTRNSNGRLMIISPREVTITNTNDASGRASFYLDAGVNYAGKLDLFSSNGTVALNSRYGSGDFSGTVTSSNIIANGIIYATNASSDVVAKLSGTQLAFNRDSATFGTIVSPDEITIYSGLANGNIFSATSSGINEGVVYANYLGVGNSNPDHTYKLDVNGTIANSIGDLQISGAPNQNDVSYSVNINGGAGNAGYGGGSVNIKGGTESSGGPGGGYVNIFGGDGFNSSAGSAYIRGGNVNADNLNAGNVILSGGNGQSGSTASSITLSGTTPSALNGTISMTGPTTVNNALTVNGIAVLTNNVILSKGNLYITNHAYDVSTSQLDPEANEYVTASFVRSVLNNGAFLYGTTNTIAVGFSNILTASTNKVSLQFGANPPVSYTKGFTNFVTGTYPNGPYFASIVSTNTYQAVTGPFVNDFYIQADGSGGGHALGIAPDIFVTYDLTNLIPICAGAEQSLTMAATTNLYTWIQSAAQYNSTNSAGFYVVRRVRVTSQNGNNLYINVKGGSGTATTLAFSTPVTINANYSGTFTGNGSGLTNIPATGITGLGTAAYSNATAFAASSVTNLTAGQIATIAAAVTNGASPILNFITSTNLLVTQVNTNVVYFYGGLANGFVAYWSNSLNVYYKQAGTFITNDLLGGQTWAIYSSSTRLFYTSNSTPATTNWTSINQGTYPAPTNTLFGTNNVISTSTGNLVSSGSFTGSGSGLTNIPATGIVGTAITNNASPTLTGLAVGAQTALDVNGNGKVGGVGLTNGVITGAITNLISTNDFAPSVVNNVGFIPTNPAVYIYRATVAQTGTAAPVPNVLYQSMTNVTWIRQAAGNYRAFCTNNYFTNFPIGKTIVNIQVGANYNLNAGDAIAVSNSATGGYGTGGAYINVGGFTDGQFNNRFIEVYVYR